MNSIEFFDFSAVTLVEPPIVVVTNQDFDVYRCNDGAVILRVGLTGAIGADTIEIPPHLLACVAATLASIAGGEA